MLHNTEWAQLYTHPFCGPYIFVYVFIFPGVPIFLFLEIIVNIVTPIPLAHFHQIYLMRNNGPSSSNTASRYLSIFITWFRTMTQKKKNPFSAPFLYCYLSLCASVCVCHKKQTPLAKKQISAVLIKANFNAKLFTLKAWHSNKFWLNWLSFIKLAKMFRGLTVVF